MSSTNPKRGMQLLEDLSNTMGVTGFEDEVQDLVIAALEPCCDKVWKDRLGNVIAEKHATKKTGGVAPRKLMYAAHADEIGFMVTHIDEHGFLRFTNIGGADPRTLMSTRVIVHGKKNIKGAIAPIPGMLRKGELANNIPEVSELYIDCGLSRAEISDIVQIGDVVSLEQRFEFLNERVVTGRNFDDRLGVYTMIEALHRMRDISVDVYAVSTVQEEVGVRGAGSAAHAIEPDVGIAIDGSLSHDIPWSKKHERRCSMGAGTGIYVMDRLTIGSPRLVRYLCELCDKENIPYQRNIGGGTDASMMQRTKRGAICTTIGAPTRYMHSTVQMAHVDDLAATIALLQVFAEHMHEFLEE